MIKIYRSFSDNYHREREFGAQDKNSYKIVIHCAQSYFSALVQKTTSHALSNRSVIFAKNCAPPPNYVSNNV